MRLNIQVALLSNVTTSTSVCRRQHFRTTYCLHL